MLRKEEEEGKRIKGLRKLKCPNHLGGCYIYLEGHKENSLKSIASAIKSLLTVLALALLYLLGLGEITAPE
ncbi:hypothetical protein PN499_08305 [Kamptonema animale CS-326]|jgi:hypothetical protein|uniref:hypothetical protein n=1 Tax=Kamptonema animale TaxID=92934 RepID=UPI00232D3EE3|nr:hypothetical protein [Kamptonema animale]MDB9511182.1 hypothetical protein [Kamptonema animale CS-326]